MNINIIFLFLFFFPFLLLLQITKENKIDNIIIIFFCKIYVIIFLKRVINSNVVVNNKMRTINNKLGKIKTKVL